MTLALASLILCAVGILNGGPIFYPDTAAYLIDADRLFHLQAPYAVRPVFYGLLIWPLYAITPTQWMAGFALALFTQAAVITHLIYLTLRVIGTGIQPVGFLVLMATLVVLTPASFHASHMLPDVFIPVMALAMFLLAFCREGLGTRETVYLFLLAAVSASLHLTALPIGLAIVGLALIVRWTGRLPSRPLLAAGPLVLAMVTMLGFSGVVYQRLTLTPNSPPHLLARILTDGPGTDYLKAVCPEAGYTLCRYLDKLPPTYEGFLWDIMPSMPTADGYAVKSEQAAIIKGTFRMFPAQEAWHAVDNALWQTVTIESETHFTPREWSEFVAGGSPLAIALSKTRQAQGAFDGQALDGINKIHAVITFLALLVVIGTLPRLFSIGMTRVALLSLTTLTLLLANALACGALSGVFARYQGRVIWLLPLVAVAAISTVLQHATAPRNTASPYTK